MNLHLQIELSGNNPELLKSVFTIFILNGSVDCTWKKSTGSQSKGFVIRIVDRCQT